MSTVSKIICYPLKSGAGVCYDFTHGNENGLTGDRLFCLFCPETKKFVSLRDNHKLEDILLDSNEFAINITVGSIIQCFHLQNIPNIETIKMWSRNVEVTTYPGAISDYISSYLKMNVILAKVSNFSDYKQSFMDTGPIHIISQKSLDALSRHVGLGEISASVFRPNIIVPDFGIENETDIKKITINDFVFNVTEVTERCDAVSILHRKLQSVSDSPILEILDELNDFDGAVFGIYVRSETDFCIHINDVVEVI
ncbi:MOSC domain-containing protein [Rahnella sikkimica]|uniref:MOSC domain-containing protein n=1 Tax=Rahnella sikkimica TaxID=1805933 RepID=A0A2L1UZ71_9GAMM|nr:MOSC domain-containing protein [Rahnella sikkimica]AVF38259.1 hypothetical protein BV494_25625 [Rahnella sikkimica]